METALNAALIGIASGVASTFVISGLALGCAIGIKIIDSVFYTFRGFEEDDPNPKGKS